MLVAAALVPDTALLVPGAAGASDLLPGLRQEALSAVELLTRARPDRVVVVGPRHPGRPVHRTDDGVVHLTGPLSWTLAAAGIGDAYLGRDRPRDTEVTVVTVVADVAPAVGLHLLERVGWTGAREVVVVPADPELARGTGDRLAREPVRTALLLVGSLSARRGPDGPLADDARAPAVDDRVLADLLGLADDAGGAERDAHGRPDDAHGDAWDRLTGVPAALAAELAISAWAPWQVLCGATGPGGLRGPGRDGPGPRAEAGRRWCATLRWAGAPFGATYAVVTWEPR